MYFIKKDGSIFRDDDGASIPADELNRDYAEYLAWVAAGNTARAYAGVSGEAPGGDWAAYQGRAATALDNSDKTILRCYEKAIKVPVEWSVYRDKLRAILSMQDGDATQPLPTQPAYPAGS